MKNKRTPEEWRNEVRRYQKSGLSFNGYCRENGISPSTLVHWKKKFISSPAKVEKKLIKIPTPTSNERKMRLTYNRLSIEFPADLSDSKIALLISALKEI